jgi:hypothetical protein
MRYLLIRPFLRSGSARSDPFQSEFEFRHLLPMFQFLDMQSTLDLQLDVAEPGGSDQSHNQDHYRESSERNENPCVHRFFSSEITGTATGRLNSPPLATGARLAGCSARGFGGKYQFSQIATWRPLYPV